MAMRRCDFEGCNLKHAGSGLCVNCRAHQYGHGDGSIVSGFQGKRAECEEKMTAWLEHNNLKPGKYPNSLHSLRVDFCKYLNLVEPGLGDAYGHAVRPVLWMNAFVKRVPWAKLKANKKVTANSVTKMSYTVGPYVGPFNLYKSAETGQVSVNSKEQAIKLLRELDSEGPPTATLPGSDKKQSGG